jgi:hypothetical protein
LSGGISRLGSAPEPAHRVGWLPRDSFAIAVAESKVVLRLGVLKSRRGAIAPHGARQVPADTNAAVVKGAKVEESTCMILGGRELPVLGGALGVTATSISGECQAIAQPELAVSIAFIRAAA